MKRQFSALIFTLVTGVLARAQTPSAARSLKELPTLSNVLITHFACAAKLTLSSAPDAHSELKFDVAATAKGLSKQELNVQEDHATISVDSETLEVQWLRKDQIVAIALTSRTDSIRGETRLTAVDPLNPSQKIDIACKAVMVTESK